MEKIFLDCEVHIDAKYLKFKRIEGEYATVRYSTNSITKEAEVFRVSMGMTVFGICANNLELEQELRAAAQDHCNKYWQEQESKEPEMFANHNFITPTF